ncbi:hypothetical protein POM88_000897 [Heracleum sosnowskyi]|uniref:DC1 domain-containing protein n=1 Tax=Heracleum sosnowskyi TaxID=360622 RepID=A0AAD8JF46_9APIA|nr:hypothetical protein POM88_000897 [Heracleum sosnowskyi]
MCENATEVDDEEDANHSKSVQFPVRNDEHHMYYRLIQDFAKTCSSTSTDNHISTTEDGIISHCTRGYLLGLIDEHMRKDIRKLNELLCDGCFQPLSATADSFYGCVNCKLFLHKVCFTELPRIIEHPSHPQHKLVRRLQIDETITCNICNSEWDGIFYQCERSSSCSFIIDIMCTLLPRTLKHESHKHSLTQQLDNSEETCYGCSLELEFGHFRCSKCRFRLHAGCAISPGTVKHR